MQGYLTSQDYKERTEVKKDALLFQIDPRPLAALAQAQPAQKQAELTANRNVDLFNRKAISDQERDNAVQAAAVAKAQSDAQEAAVEQAQLNLDFTAIRSPVDGIAGLATAQLGDLVGPSTGVLTTVSKVNPIKAYFTISDQRYVTYTQRYADPAKRAAHEKDSSSSSSSRTVRNILRPGDLFAAQNQVDVRTGTVRSAAIFPNPGNILRPGEFARVRVRTDVQKGALLVPRRAVIELQGSYQLALVGPDNKVHIQPVEVGRRIGDGDRGAVAGVNDFKERGVAHFGIMRHAAEDAVSLVRPPKGIAIGAG